MSLDEVAGAWYQGNYSGRWNGSGGPPCSLLTRRSPVCDRWDPLRLRGRLTPKITHTEISAPPKNTTYPAMRSALNTAAILLRTARPCHLSRIRQNLPALRQFTFHFFTFSFRNKSQVSDNSITSVAPVLWMRDPVEHRHFVEIERADALETRRVDTVLIRI